MLKGWCGSYKTDNLLQTERKMDRYVNIVNVLFTKNTII